MGHGEGWVGRSGKPIVNPHVPKCEGQGDMGVSGRSSSRGRCEGAEEGGEGFDGELFGAGVGGDVGAD